MRILRLRWVLPIGQLLICSGIVWFDRSQAASHPPVLRFEHGVINLHLDPHRPSDFPWAINMPGVVFLAPQAIFSSDHTAWVPPGWSWLGWRNATLSTFCCPFWWAVGDALDGSGARDRRRGASKWIKVVLALTALGGGALAIGFFLAGHGQVFVWCGVLWIALGSIGAYVNLRRARIVPSGAIS